jgi:aspartokinase/homoserine dehydrogenase 1
MSVTSPRILKFGGSSVGSPVRLRQVLHLTREAELQGPVALVVSAMGDSTDWLLEATAEAQAGRIEASLAALDRVHGLATDNLAALTAQLRQEGLLVHEPADIRAGLAQPVDELRRLLQGIAIVGECTARSRDLALSVGERLSVQVVATLLAAMGAPAQAVDARTWVVTDDGFGEATVDRQATAQRLRDLADTWVGKVPVHTGFLGATTDGWTTTLGRNGSDYTASLLAHGLQAKEVCIWTDVSGVMTGDPDLVRDAYPVPHLSHTEALELAGLGLKMLHPRAMLPLLAAGVPLRVRNTMRPSDPGTLVDSRGSDDLGRPACVTSLEQMALLDVRANILSEHGLALTGTTTLPRESLPGRVLAVLADAGVAVWFETSSAKGTGIAVVVQQADVARANIALHKAFASELREGDIEPILCQQPVTLLTLVAETMGKTPGVAGRFFGALGAIGINIRASSQGASQRAISAVIDDADTPQAVRTVHDSFNLAAQRVSLLVLGKGVVGRELLQQIQQSDQHLLANHDLSLRVVGLVDSQRALFEPDGLELQRWPELVAQAHPQPVDLPALLDQLTRLPAPILVDCTASDQMELVYEQAFARGIHVVGANKKPLTIATDDAKRLADRARQRHRQYRYETTVGASLPIIQTLKDLVRTGDRVRLIEGSLSGTLGYLCNELMAGVPLSEAVWTAKQRGFTEPHPRDDLGGVDAARKGLILARELGMRVELDWVTVQPFVPFEYLLIDDVDVFFAKLKTYDAVMKAQIDRLKEEGKVLRYLVRIDPSTSPDDAITVGPAGVPADHPSTRLRGSEAFVAFTTDRYSDYPLVVQGAGAGGAVTAAGVLADVLAIAQSLRGR